jgi:hypothetical protein
VFQKIVLSFNLRYSESSTDKVLIAACYITLYNANGLKISLNYVSLARLV